MRHVALASLALLSLSRPAAALDFTGPVAPANWTATNTGTLLGGSPTLGSAAFSTTQLVLTGSNSQSPTPGSEVPSCAGGSFQTLGPCRTQVTTQLAGTYSFNWSYVTSDPSGVGGDLFGVLVDSVPIVVSDPGGNPAQSGSRSFSATSSFGWFMNCTDCIGGSATATVSQFNFTAAAIPEPETYALFVAGIVGVVARLKARKRASARLALA